MVRFAFGVENMNRRESHDVVANGMKSLELRGKVERVAIIRVPALIQRSDPDRISGNDQTVLNAVEEGKREYFVKKSRRFGAVLTVGVNKSFGIRVCLVLYVFRPCKIVARIIGLPDHRTTTLGRTIGW